MRGKLLGCPKKRRLVVGCAIESEEDSQNCLAMAVYAQRGVWRVKWAMHGVFGGRHDRGFAKRLRARVHRRSFWAPLAGLSSQQNQRVRAVDLGADGRKRSKSLKGREQRAALKTQLCQDLPNRGDPMVMVRSEHDDPDGRVHSVGAIAPKDDIRDEFRILARSMGIINPHLGSAAVGLANTYLALYPEEKRRENPRRIIILKGQDFTLICFMDDWRLLDTLVVEMFHGRRMGHSDIRDWENMIIDYGEKPEPFVPCLVRAADIDPEVREGIEVWDPFADSSMETDDDEIRALIETHIELAPIAFGMALYGD
jgi:hypothetical protein